MVNDYNGTFIGGFYRLETLVYHEIEPVFDKNSKILILGSFPSVKSRENMFFYGHPMNRFWKVIAGETGCDVPVTVEEKKQLLISNHIAVWDVIKSCSITGSSDSSIKNVVPNDLNIILREADIEQIFCNGNKSYELFNKYCEPKINRSAIKLPSTSPANAGCSLDRLVTEWEKIRKYL